MNAADVTYPLFTGLEGGDDYDPQEDYILMYQPVKWYNVVKPIYTQYMRNAQHFIDTVDRQIARQTYTP